MTTYDGTHASVAASLVIANLAFTTTLEKTPQGEEARIFRLPYKIRGRDSLVTGYVGGATLTVISAIRIEAPPSELQSKRHELADFVASKMPMVRLLTHPFSDTPADANVVWVEVSVPLPLNGEAIEPWLALTPFAAVSGAVDLLTGQFPGVTPATPASFPMQTVGRTEKVWQPNVPPDLPPDVPPG